MNSCLKFSRLVVKMAVSGRDLQFPSFGVMGMKLLENMVLLSLIGERQNKICVERRATFFMMPSSK